MSQPIASVQIVEPRRQRKHHHDDKQRQQRADLYPSPNHRDNQQHIGQLAQCRALSQYRRPDVDRHIRHMRNDGAKH